MLVFIMAAGERVGGHQTAQFVVKRVELNSRRCFSASRVGVLLMLQRKDPYILTTSNLFQGLSGT